jgi:hypothetical protein
MHLSASDCRNRDAAGLQMTDSAERTPRSVPGLIAEAFGLYRRYAGLFLTLAAGVIVPYELIVLAATGADPYNRATSLSFVASQLLVLIDWVLVNPLVSALHVHAVADIEEGLAPRIGAVARRGLAVLPVVAGAALVAGLGFFGGLVLLVIPGIILWLRWQVAAQAAAIEREGWRQALRRSWSLTEANVIRVPPLLRPPLPSGDPRRELEQHLAQGAAGSFT